MFRQISRGNVEISSTRPILDNLRILNVYTGDETIYFIRGSMSLGTSYRSPKLCLYPDGFVFAYGGILISHRDGKTKVIEVSDYSSRVLEWDRMTYLKALERLFREACILEGLPTDFLARLENAVKVLRSNPLPAPAILTRQEIWDILEPWRAPFSKKTEDENWWRLAREIARTAKGKLIGGWKVNDISHGFHLAFELQRADSVIEVIVRPGIVFVRQSPGSSNQVELYCPTSEILSPLKPASTADIPPLVDDVVKLAKDFLAEPVQTWGSAESQALIRKTFTPLSERRLFTMAPRRYLYLVSSTKATGKRAFTRITRFVRRNSKEIMLAEDECSIYDSEVPFLLTIKADGAYAKTSAEATLPILSEDYLKKLQAYALLFEEVLDELPADAAKGLQLMNSFLSKPAEPILERVAKLEVPSWNEFAQIRKTMGMVR